MDMTKLSDVLLSDSQRGQSQEGFLDAWERFVRFFQGLSGFAVYFCRTDGYAYVANTVFLLRRLQECTQFQGEICLVYDQNDQRLCRKLQGLLPFWKGGGYRFAASADEVRQPLVVCGGGDFTDPFYARLPSGVRYVLAVRPYLDDGAFSFIKIRDAQANWITYFTDTICLNQNFHTRSFFVDLPKVCSLDDQSKAYWHGCFEHLEGAEALLGQKEGALFTVDGAAFSAGGMDRGDSVMFILTCACLLEYQRTGRTQILAAVNCPSGDRGWFLFLQQLLDRKKDAKALSAVLAQRYPSVEEAERKAGLLQPLLNLRGKLASVLEHAQFVDLSEHPSEMFSEKKCYICMAQELPYDYLAALFAKSRFLFFESNDWTNLAANLGIPYIQKSVEVSCSNYPDLYLPASAAAMRRICGLFAYDRLAYASAAVKQIDRQAQQVADFLQNPYTDYFQAMQDQAQGKGTPRAGQKQHAPSVANDKLAAGGIVLQMLAETAQKRTKGHVRYRNGASVRGGGASDLRQLYADFCAAYVPRTNSVNVSSVLGRTRMEGYLRELSGGDFILTMESADGIALELLEGTDAASCVTLRGRAACLDGLDLCLQFLVWYGDGCLKMQVHGESGQADAAYGMSWLPLSDLRFDVSVAENNLPVSGSVGGNFGRTDSFPGAELVLDVNHVDGISDLMANLQTPLTALDAFGAMAGGIDFSSLLPRQIASVVSLGLSGLSFSYDRVRNQLLSMEFTFANQAGHPWILWEKDGKPLLTAGPSVSVYILHPTDLAARKIQVSIGAMVDIGDAALGGAVGQLWMEASVSPFTARMYLASETLSLAKLLELFGAPADFEAELTSLPYTGGFGKPGLPAFLRGAGGMADLRAVYYNGPVAWHCGPCGKTFGFVCGKHAGLPQPFRRCRHTLSKRKLGAFGGCRDGRGPADVGFGKCICKRKSCGV